MLSILAFVGVIFGLTKDVTTTKLSSVDYAIDSIDSTGKIVDSKLSLYSKKLNTVDNLAVEIDEKTATITYKVVYYDENEEYISTSEAAAKDLVTSDIPSSAKYFRIVITPDAVDGEAVELNIFNVSKYTSQLKVTFTK